MDLVIAEAAAAAEGAAPISPQLAILLGAACLALAVIFFFAEVMVPSFGLLTVCGLACIVGSCVFGFMASNTMGVVFIVLNILTIPVVILVIFKWLPHSPVVIAYEIPASSSGVEPGGDKLGQDLTALVGKKGVALTRLNPGGTARVEGTRYDVVSTGDWIDANAAIEVVAVNGNRVEVRALEV